MAASGDSLRVFKYEGDSLAQRSSLMTEKKDSPPPLTSLDWNQANPARVGTSSVNTTCTIWDLEKETIIAHMIAHDQPAYDIAFSDSESIFATAGGDGSIRQFDLRNLESSTVLYEKPDVSACLRLAWNKNEPNYLATITLDSSSIVVLDVRHAAVPVYTLNGHNSCVNALAWSPIDGSHLTTGADDHQAFLWDIQQSLASIEPTFVYSTDSEINNVAWSYANPEWIAISKSKDVDILRI
jgi:WD repeat-containing protein 68